MMVSCGSFELVNLGIVDLDLVGMQDPPETTGKNSDDWEDGLDGRYIFQLKAPAPNMLPEGEAIPLTYILQWTRGHHSSCQLSPLRVTYNANAWPYSEPDRSPLHLLARHARVHMMETILKEGANVNVRAKNMSVDVTALHLAVLSDVSSNRRETVRTLLIHGADPEAKGKGKGGHVGSCLDFALQEGQDHLRELRKDIQTVKGSPSSLFNLSRDAVKSSVWESLRQKENYCLIKAKKEYKKAIESLEVPIDVKTELRF